jgi:hypothetical protein
MKICMLKYIYQICIKTYCVNYLFVALKYLFDCSFGDATLFECQVSLINSYANSNANAK